MTINIGINGLGRIGRTIVRALVENNHGDFKLIAANGPASIETHLHLLKYDSVHGAFRGELSIDGDHIRAGNQRFLITREKDPSKLNWAKLGVDMVLECSGKFNSKDASLAHIKAGAKKVLISAPAEGVDATIVYGVNNEALKSEPQVISVGSCTTNCLAPIAKILNDTVGIECGFMTTIHSYTGDQNIVDGSHKDLRRARAAAMSMIPTSTGAAKALGLVLPELAGKLNGVAIRVPTSNVSMIDLTFTATRTTNKDEINQALTNAANGAYKGVVDVCSEPLVSIDFNHHPASAIADLTQTFVTGDRFVRVSAWYDNEWGFSNRMLDVARLLSLANA